MPTINSDQFGARVVDALGAAPEFSEWPDLPAGLRYAAAWSCSDFVYGDYGAPEKVTGALFAVRCGEIADKLVADNDNLDLGWTSRPLRAAFMKAAADEFERCKETHP